MILPLLASLALASAPCTQHDLRSFNGMLQGATGSMLGTVRIRNASGRPCALGGRPLVQITDRTGHVFRTREQTFTLSSTGAHARSTLLAHRRAVLHLDWSNWCGAWSGSAGSFRRLFLRVTLTDGSRLRLPLTTGRPRCDQPKAPSILSVSAFGDA